MAGWHHQCNGRELGQTSGDCEGQEAWHAAVHGVTKSWTLLRDWETTARFLSRLCPVFIIVSSWRII